MDLPNFDEDEFSELDMDKFLRGINESVDRRERYCALQLSCPKCQTKQIQLIGYQDDAEWKCRHCKFKFQTKEKDLP